MAVVDQAPSPALQPPVATPISRRGSLRGVTVLYTGTAFLGAALLFLVEPLVAKLLLPSFGGSATVWSTCTLFFQVLLLAAYGYCHLSTSRLSRSRQPRWHLALLLLPLAALPLTVPTDAAPPADAMPVLWLLKVLAVLVGLPFVVVATTGPLLQKWYSWTSHERADDPYFLFAASNLGSFVGLLAYPFWVEPTFSLADQRRYWSAAYVVFLLLTGACALVASRQRAARPTAPGAAEPLPSAAGPSTRRKLVWAGWAMLPSTLMLGVTSHLSTDVASIPLLWVVPLAVYLGSFVLAFARTSRSLPRGLACLAVSVTLVEVVASLSGPVLPIAVSVTTSLLMLAVVAFAAHARLAADRPAPEHLTTFYMVVAAGGALGGVLNGFVAPVVFSAVVEYPIALCGVPLLLVGVVAAREDRLARVLGGNRVRLACAAIVFLLVALGLRAAVAVRGTELTTAVLLLGLTGTLGWLSARRTTLALLTVLFLFATNVAFGTHGVVERSRTFYGTYRVVSESGKHILVHGTTVHGTEFTDAARRDVPTTYYARGGPLGDVFSVANQRGVRSVAAVGLGAGTVAAYGRTGQRFTFFEIDPEVVRIAEDPRFFGYLHDSAATVRTVTGDGRLALLREPEQSFDLIVLDAFSSDAIPVHLLTREAVAMYASRLRPGGMLAFHISNRVFDLGPVLADSAATMRWAAAERFGGSAEDGATASRWVVVTAPGGAADVLRRERGWISLDGRRVPWTDDYSSVLTVLR
jgi:SAM-dependent methyltransferase